MSRMPFATGQRGDKDRGLTDLGIKAVEIIENLGNSS